MNKVQHFFSILILLVVFMFAVSCDSVNSDAKEAASLTNKSIEKTSQLKLDLVQMSKQACAKEINSRIHSEINVIFAFPEEKILQVLIWIKNHSSLLLPQ